MRLVAYLLLLLLSSAPAGAHEYNFGDLTIGHPWARATPGGVRNGVVYLTMINDGKTGERLLKATTPIAAEASLHTNIKDGDVVRMRPVEFIDVPAGKTVELKPGALHLMLMGLKQPLKSGDMVPLTLIFEKAGDIQVEVMVEDQ